MSKSSSHQMSHQEIEDMLQEEIARQIEYWDRSRRIFAAYVGDQLTAALLACENSDATDGEIEEAEATARKLALAAATFNFVNN